MKTGYKVGDVMTISPIVISSDKNIVDCSKLMKDKHVGAVVIREKEDDKSKIGLLTEQDIVREVIAKGKDPLNTRLSEVMVENLVTISPDKDVFDALSKMKELNIRHLPVIDNEEMVGLLTLKDILKIEPQLFELMVDRIELREEERKPIHRKSENEGMCNLCGEYTTELKEKDGVMVCEDCSKGQ